MTDAAKETVIIVHGTWAAPEPDKCKWYEPPNGLPNAMPFVSKLDAALAQRGSPARCWAHCTDGKQVFTWSGENSWIGRTRAGASLAQYVTGLQKEGWRCHILGHSHGGNVVAEALPEIMQSRSFDRLVAGKIATLGTPFIDSKSEITRSDDRWKSFQNWTIWASYAILAALWVLHFATRSDNAILRAWSEMISNPIDLFISVLFLLVPIAAIIASWAAASRPTDCAPFLAIGSSLDEAWQVLHHVRTMPNPLSVNSGLVRYLIGSRQTYLARSVAAARAEGRVSFGELSAAGKWLLASSMIVCIVVGIVEGIYVWKQQPHFSDTGEVGIIDLAMWKRFFFDPLGKLTIGMSLLWLVFREMYRSSFSSVESANLAPYRWVRRQTESLLAIPTHFVTYYVRRRAWTLIQEMAMGLEDYRHALPNVGQRPRYTSDSFVKYEDMPKGAEQRALAQRDAWISRHFGDVTETFSKMVVTASDLSALLRLVEADESLVHAAYYTDDECIARIADWIAGPDTERQPRKEPAQIPTTSVTGDPVPTLVAVANAIQAARS